jgi:hypothetical protein
MSHLEDYQVTTLGELFHPDLIENTLEQVDSTTPQQEAVLQFIVDNPDEQFITLQNTFSMPAHLVVGLVIEYGTPSEDYDEMVTLKQKMKQS